RRSPQSTTATETTKGLLPWRQVVEPHRDVASGEFQQAEFAADLAKVHKGSAPAEYSDPQEFFSRTYLTEGLKALLVGAAQRLSGKGGDPVVELQTNFGGGKTHSMLALYHMAGKKPVQDLPGLDQLLAAQGLDVPAQVNRAVLVGTARGPLDVIKLKGGQEIRTTWGALAWQLGQQKAYDLVADHDASGIAPGSNLLETLFKTWAPSLILIDEWVAYLRQIYKVDGLPSGSFDANLSFVQALTEAVKTSPQTLLVASLPASRIEVGGEGGQEALARLKQTFSRVESSWRPASQEESYEIVRRRLFKEIPGDQYKHRDNTLKQFAKLYRESCNSFPQGCADEDYRSKLDKAYPIHPDLFDHLYTAWGSLEQFQRTRGVLRLMAQVIHELWMSEDSSVMLMPGNVPIGSDRLETELLRYLPDAWRNIIAGDVDGPTSTPHAIDKSAPNLGRYSAAQRVARAVFVATAATEGQNNLGIDNKRIHLGVIQPGEKIPIFADALRRLASQAKFMHNDSGRCWYSMSSNLNRMASDRAGQLEEDRVLEEINKRLSTVIKGATDRGHFGAVQVAPNNSADVPEEPEGVRAVVLGVAHTHTSSRNRSSDAMAEVRNMFQQRGNAPRIYRNTLVFLAADHKKLDTLQEAMAMTLAWDSIVRDADNGRLDLRTSQINIAKAKAVEAQETVQTRLKETWCHLITPYQDSPQADVEFTSSRIPSQDDVLRQASKKLVGDEALLPEIGPERLNRELEKDLWADKPHLSLKDLWEYLNRYTYLPRLKHRQTLINAVKAAVGGAVAGPFAYAQRWNAETESYDGLVIENAPHAPVVLDSESLIVRQDVARSQPSSTPTAGAEQPRMAGSGAPITAAAGGGQPQQGTLASSAPRGMGGEPKAAAEPRLTRFQGTVMLSADRPIKDMSQIVEAIVEQLTTLPGADVSLKLEIDAEVATGLDRAKVRTLRENATTLGFIDNSID
ncbi:MAG: ATPase AAA, partial [Candidatus Synechococcus spongiarum 142]